LIQQIYSRARATASYVLSCWLTTRVTARMAKVAAKESQSSKFMRAGFA
jgi:hypothetical protein